MKSILSKTISFQPRALGGLSRWQWIRLFVTVCGCVSVWALISNVCLGSVYNTGYLMHGLASKKQTNTDRGEAQPSQSERNCRTLSNLALSLSTFSFAFFTTAACATPAGQLPLANMPATKALCSTHSS